METTRKMDKKGINHITFHQKIAYKGKVNRIFSMLPSRTLDQVFQP